MIRYALVLPILLLSMVSPGFSQADSSESEYGYVSIDYDPGAGQVTAYAESYLDNTLAGDYFPSVSIAVYDQNNGDYSQTCQYDPYENSDVTCQFPGTPGYTYTAYAWHIANASTNFEPYNCYGQEGSPGCVPGVDYDPRWADPDNMIYFSDLGLSSYGGFHSMHRVVIKRLIPKTFNWGKRMTRHRQPYLGMWRYA